MKRRIFLMLAALFVAGSGVASAQQDFDPRFGPDPATREQNVRLLNFFNDAYNAKDYDIALGYLYPLIESAPAASENVYIRGREIYLNKVQRAQTRQEREMYVDSLLWFFDRHIDAFGENSKVGVPKLLQAKAMAAIGLVSSNHELIAKVSRDAIAAGVVDPAMIVPYFNTVVEGYRLDDVTGEQLLETYNDLSTLLSNYEGDVEEARLAVEQLFVNSGAASCENIEKLFRPQYEADPTNTDLIEKILGLFQRGNCSSDFQLALLERYYETNPTPELAMQLSGIFSGRGDNAKSAEYTRIALNGITDPTQKAALLTQLAGTALSQNSYRETASYAQQIIATDPNNAYGYFFLANAYGQGSASACSAFDRQTVYWLVVDNLQRARNLAGDDASLMSQINSQIGSYAANFPKTEETFMRGMEPGQAYTVNCGWISGRTTVRER